MNLMRRGDFLVIAHRGHSDGYVENSREAFEAAIEAGTDLIETDVRLSGDGTMFCNHDPDLERVRGTDRSIAELPDSALDALGVLRLTEVLEIARGRVGVLLDLKLAYRDYPVLVYETVRDLGMQSSVVFGVRSPGQAQALHSKAPDAVILGFLNSPADIPIFYAAGGGIARLWEDEATAASVAAARGGNHPVWITAGQRKAGTAGEIDEVRLRRLIDLEIDGVLVNAPGRALALRREETAS
ncbi:MAG TPA: glycerophosphodiester phosphodiesterase family protein [Alphaproteobacteria bacterium]|nr:glycerophosphodiester phosphodiesterase family protein [Alphaproteobacteria bacterium]